MANRYARNSKGHYPCPYCEFESPTPQGIGKHVQMIHGGHAVAKAVKANGAATTSPPLDLSATGFNGSDVAQADKCEGTPAGNPDRMEQMMTIYPPMTAETKRVRRVCNAAVSLLTDSRYRELPPAMKWDVLAVMRMRLMEETNTADALLTADVMGGSLDPLATTPAPA